MNASVIDALLRSSEPSVRYKVKRFALRQPPDSGEIARLRQQVKESERVLALLDGRDASGELVPANGPYKKWQGAHWVMASLADIGYPGGDDDLMPLCEQLYREWLSPCYLKELHVDQFQYQRDFVQYITGRARRCASQQGNALYSIVTLGLFDDRCHTLADLLLRWQWPDGGWNCDKKPEAAKSSFYETITPLRGLIAYAKQTGSGKARAAAAKAADVFLRRRLYKRLSDGLPMKTEFTGLHYPNYWRYDILHGLKVMAEGGFIEDPRCADALDLLESMELPGGGWPATAKHYGAPDRERNGSDRVDWGGARKSKMNEWVTADALGVLVAAGRLNL